MTAEATRAQCEADGASLPVPRSINENDFYAALYPTGQVWLGLTTTLDGTTVITKNLDGTEAWFTNWGADYIHTEDTAGAYAEDTSATEAYAYIDIRNLSEGMYADMNRWNNNKANSDLENAVCVYKIPSKRC